MRCLSRLSGLMLLLALCGPAAGADAAPALRSWLMPAAALESLRGAATLRSPAQQAAVTALLAKADAALTLKAPSVLDKTLTPASGDRHDYLSFGPYWWPDPAKPDGLPYLRRDGERNPAVATGSDGAAFARVCATVETLGLAYAITRDERYAAKAAALARTWFLDPRTRMNPNFQHAQAIPGVSTGRGIGIIEARWLMQLNEGLALLAPSAAWNAQDRVAMRQWMAAIYTWLTTSENGRDEQREHNNHGTWYDAQVAHLALVLGRDADARSILREGLNLRLAAHVEPDGSQPHEMSRTRSLDYAIFNLEALMLCAQLARHVGVDWWNFATPDGRSLYGALSYLAPYADPAKAWPRRDVLDADRRRLVPLLAQFLQHRDDAMLRRVHDDFWGTQAADSRARLLGAAPLPRP